MKALAKALSALMVLILANSLLAARVASTDTILPPPNDMDERGGWNTDAARAIYRDHATSEIFDPPMEEPLVRYTRETVTEILPPFYDPRPALAWKGVDFDGVELRPTLPAASCVAVIRESKGYSLALMVVAATDFAPPPVTARSIVGRNFEAGGIALLDSFMELGYAQHDARTLTQTLLADVWEDAANLPAQSVFDQGYASSGSLRECFMWATQAGPGMERFILPSNVPVYRLAPPSRGYMHHWFPAAVLAWLPTASLADTTDGILPSSDAIRAEAKQAAALFQERLQVERLSPRIVRARVAEFEKRIIRSGNARASDVEGQEKALQRFLAGDLKSFVAGP